MEWIEFFRTGHSYESFLERFATPDQTRSWAQYREQVRLSGPQRTLLESFTREINVLCMAGAWCGDCVQQCPIFDVFEKTASSIQVRYIDRDENDTLKDRLKICGGSRVPQIVFLSEEGAFVGRNGDRTLSRYRDMAASQLGAACPSGIIGQSGDPVLNGVIQDWLDEFERIHWILRLSPRLRQIHQD